MDLIFLGKLFNAAYGLYYAEIYVCLFVVFCVCLLNMNQPFDSHTKISSFNSTCQRNHWMFEIAIIPWIFSASNAFQFKMSVTSVEINNYDSGQNVTHSLITLFRNFLTTTILPADNLHNSKRRDCLNGQEPVWNLDLVFFWHSSNQHATVALLIFSLYQKSTIDEIRKKLH